MAEEQNNVAPEPQRSIRKKILHFIVGALTLLVLLGVLFCHHVGIRSTSDIAAYGAMWREDFPPIWKDLARGRIKKGDSIESVLQKHPLAYREDAGSYTSLDYFTGGLCQRGVIVIAKDGKLIAAKANGNGWQHLFFESPEQGETFRAAHRRFKERKQLEADAYEIHCAITAGQDVFLSDHVERRHVLLLASEDKEMLEQLKEIYGDKYIQSTQQTHEELAVEVKDVLSGDLEPGTVLMFEDTYHGLQTSEKVFLHFDDDHALSPHARGEPANLTVSKSALDWYESLTPEQIQELVARRSDK